VLYCTIYGILWQLERTDWLPHILGTPSMLAANRHTRPSSSSSGSRVNWDCRHESIFTAGYILKCLQSSYPRFGLPVLNFLYDLVVDSVNGSTYKTSNVHSEVLARRYGNPQVFAEGDATDGPISRSPFPFLPVIDHCGYRETCSKSSTNRLIAWQSEHRLPCYVRT
jgi:hypothetical protein